VISLFSCGASIFVVSVLVFGLFRHFSSSKNNTTPSFATERERCWMRDAYDRGDVWFGSHRSFADASATTQPTCVQALEQLRSNKIRYLDVDLVYDPKKSKLMVSHPMEFKRTTQYYSPCALIPLTDLIELLDQVYEGRKNWTFSLEPKANWDRNEEEDVALQPPAVVLEAVLKVAQTYKLEPSSFIFIVDSNKVIDKKEKELMTQLQPHCDLSFAIRRHELPTAKKGLQLMIYKYLMPTIEFHPGHTNSEGGKDLKTLDTKDDALSLNSVQAMVPEMKSIYWIMDSRADLERAASLRSSSLGMISNHPIEMTKIIHDDAWCPSKHLRQS
jgi:hypothetical protein